MTRPAGRRAPAAALAALVWAAALWSCGSEERPPPPGGGVAERRAVELSISASDGRGKPRRATLECENGKATATGFPGRDPEELCLIARRLGPFIASRPNPRRVCTQIYGGPQLARVEGTIEGQEVKRRFSRSDGCRIAEWDRVATLIPLEPR